MVVLDAIDDWNSRFFPAETIDFFKSKYGRHHNVAFHQGGKYRQADATGMELRASMEETITQDSNAFP